jgi:hypothetical protein
VTDPLRADDVHRNPMPCEELTFELTNYPLRGPAGRIRSDDLVAPVAGQPNEFTLIFDSELAYEASPTTGRQRRPIEHTRTLYRRDDLSALLPLGQCGALALPGESYRLALTPGLLTNIVRRTPAGQPAEDLLPAPRDVLGRATPNGAGYVASDDLKAANLFPSTEPDGHWWQPSGRVFYSPGATDSVATERASARTHFHVPRRYQDAFLQNTVVEFAYDVLPVQITDALGNATRASRIDYRVLQPVEITDANGNRSAALHDALGMLAAVATMGKAAPAPVEGDNLAGVMSDPPASVVLALVADPFAGAAALLGNASSRMVYDLHAYMRTRTSTNPQPASTCSLVRETHQSDLAPGATSRLVSAFSYSDGFGREIQKKIEAERQAAGVPRWVGSGTTVYNNKGKPVRQYEAYFTGTHTFERGRFDGVATILFYDPADRVVVTLKPDRTYEKIVFEAWMERAFDGNDTATPRGSETGDPRTDPDIGPIVAAYFSGVPATWQTWYQQRITGALGVAAQEAARRTEVHSNTPATSHLDVLGHGFLATTAIRHERDGNVIEATETTRTLFDIEGNQRELRDSIVQAGDAQGRVVARHDFDMLGNRIRESNIDGGTRWMLSNVLGNPVRRWDTRGHNFIYRYDALRRLTELYVRGTSAQSDPRTRDRYCLVERIEYGETVIGAEQRNLRKRVYRHFDSAGLLTYGDANPNSATLEAYDFKGNVLRTRRALLRDFRILADWTTEPELQAEAFVTLTRYDAMNRTIQSVPAHSDRAGSLIHVIQPSYNEANLLERIDVWLSRMAEPAQLLDPLAVAPAPVGVSAIDYNARGQRERIDYRNGTSTFYQYDAETFRLLRLYTRRDASFTTDCDNPQPPPPTIAAPDSPPAGVPCGLQNLAYTYDAVGNVMRITDTGQQTLFFRNRRVEPTAEYRYDSSYRLIEATGREHLGQVGGAPIPHSNSDAPRVAIDWSANDGNAMGTYLERYVYDTVGNLLEMQHRSTDPATAGWTRAYEYAESSAIEAGKTANRLTRSRMGSATPDELLHDLHGNIRRLPHLGAGLPDANLHWDYRDQLYSADLGGGGVAWFVYDVAGLRVRKVVESATGPMQDRLYVGSTEFFRRTTSGGALRFARETLHVMDNRSRIARVELRTLDVDGTDASAARLIRYTLPNQIGSAILEIDEDSSITSYEEYSPYGTPPTRRRATSRSAQASPLQRQGTRHGNGPVLLRCRYYAPWLGRWTACDRQQHQPIRVPRWTRHRLHGHRRWPVEPAAHGTRRSLGRRVPGTGSLTWECSQAHRETDCV